MSEITITALGRTQTLAKWADETGIAYNTLHARLFVYGWQPEDAVSRPAGHYRYHRRRRMTATNRRRTVKRLAAAGCTADEIASETGWTARTIHYDLQTMDMSRKDRQRWRRKRVWALVGKMSQTDIARKLGLHRKTVHNDIRAVMADPSIVEDAPRVRRGEQCECGQDAIHAAPVRIKERQTELHLCEDCYALFREVEGVT